MKKNIMKQSGDESIQPIQPGIFFEDLDSDVPVSLEKARPMNDNWEYELHPGLGSPDGESKSLDSDLQERNVSRGR